MSDRIPFRDGPIEGVNARPLKKYEDKRGWLAEIFRSDELAGKLMPVMSYVSVTHPGVSRGPHEHLDQTDLFCFIGPSNFKLVLWDNRPDSPTFRSRMMISAGEDNPALVVVPPGVVHAYKNVGEKEGWVINLPNRLYRGRGRKDNVDEIRHEDDPHSEFTIDSRKGVKPAKFREIGRYFSLRSWCLGAIKRSDRSERTRAKAQSPPSSD